MTTTLRVKAKAPSVARQRVRAFAIQERTPPSEIQLWSAGENATDYGVHLWTERSASEVLAVYNDRGNPILVDIEHNGPALEDGEPAETAGYAKLELRGDVPWLVFDWSATGAEQIATGQRRFLSPEYDVDPATNEIVRLYRVSLVADPATHRARILASASQGRLAMNEQLTAIQAILDSVADPAEALAAVKGYIANATGDAPTDTTEETPPSDPTPAFAAADDKPDDEKKPPVAASAPAPVAPKVVETKPATAPIVAAAPPKATDEETVAIRAAREHAERSENALRDVLLAQHGHRLQPSIRTWASTQKLDVVKGLIAAAPDPKPIPTKVSATRGEGHGTGKARKGLEGKELEELQRGMGTFKASTPMTPHRNERGDFVLPTVPPTEFRRMQAAAAAKEGK